MSSKCFAQDIAQRLGPSNIGRILLAAHDKNSIHTGRLAELGLS